MSTKIIPSLPPELERRIFETAARMNNNTALVLAVVAKRTQIWIEKLIYAMVSLFFYGDYNNAFLYAIKSRPPEFFATHVKSLCLQGYGSQEASQVLSVCTGLDNLAYWMYDRAPFFTIAHSTTLRLERLSIEITRGGEELLDLSLPCFTQLTHLNLSDRCTFWKLWLVLEFPRQLTHLTLELYATEYTRVDYTIKILENICKSCKYLKVCLLDVTSEMASYWRREIFENGFQIDQQIIVIMSTPVTALCGWESSIRGDRDGCTLMQAEEIIESREAARDNAISCAAG